MWLHFGYEYSAFIKLSQIGIQISEISEFCNDLAEAAKIRPSEKHDFLQNRIAFLLTPVGREIEIMLENNAPQPEIECAFLEKFLITAPDEQELFEYCTNGIREEHDLSLLESRITFLRTNNGSKEVESENEEEDKSENG